MRLVAPLLAAEVRLGIATTRRRRINGPAAVLGLEALHRRPGFDERAVDAEVVAGQQPLHPGLGKQRRQEPGCDVARQQAVAVLGEGGVVPHRIVDPEPDEPAKQQVEVEPLHQLAFRADRIERLAQHGAQEALGWDRRTPHPGIEHREVRLQRCQRLVGQLPDRSQRMIGAHPRLEVNVAEKCSRLPIRSPHRDASLAEKTSESRPDRTGERLLQQPARHRSQRRSVCLALALQTYVQERLAGVVVAPSGLAIAGPDVPLKGRRHGPRQERRWARAWSPEQIARRLPIDFPYD
jgi:hypothetical protein